MASVAGEMPKKSNYVPWLSVSVILVILATAIAFVTLHLRKFMRAQIIQQDGLLFYASSLADQLDENDLDSAEDPEIRFAFIEQKVLNSTRQRGVVAVRLFDDKGRLRLAIPIENKPQSLDGVRMEALRQFKTLSFFERHADLSEINDAEPEQAPLVHAFVPLEADESFLGVAEFVLDGQKVATSLAGLDRDLTRYAVLIFVLGGGIITASLIWAFRRLQKSNGLLFQRTQSLLRANHELTLSAKTAALGTITAHLIHDLKNPLFGLQSFVRARGAADEEDWDAAANSTQRMQKIISEVVRILQEEKTVEKYELSLDELLSIVRSGIGPDAEALGVDFLIESEADAVFSNRDANIILLIITNVARNSLQATPRGGRISVKALPDKGSLLLNISDTGPGLPPDVLSNIFTPCRSTKSGGTGLGLAISKQLASQIGAELILQKTSAAGTTFQLRVPERALAAEFALS